MTVKVRTAAELIRLAGRVLHEHEGDAVATSLAVAPPVVSLIPVPVRSVWPAGGSMISYITTPEALAGVVAGLGPAAVIALDLETYTTDLKRYPDGALDPHAGAVRLLTLAAEDVDQETGAPVAVAFVVDCQAIPDWASVLLPVLVDANVVKVAHNAKFDLKFLLKAGIEVGGVFDTMLGAQLLDGGRHLREKGYFTLGAVCDRYLGRKVDKTEQGSDWGAPGLTDAQITYAANDALVLLPLHRKLTAELEQAGLEGIAAVEMGTVPALAWLELAGAPFDGEAWAALSDGAMARKLEDGIRAMLTEGLGANTLFGHNINLDSPVQVVKALGALGVEVPNTQEEALVAVQHQHPVVPKVLAYREAAKLASTYGIEFLHHVHPATGRIHADYHQIGAATGRMSCSKPNLQQVPKIRDYRGCFRPVDGRVLVKADLSLVELCVAAELSGDERMIQAITEGQDLHRLTAAALFGKEPQDVTAGDRAFGKAVNFGTLFGQGRRGLIQLAAQHGLTLTEAQADGFRRRFAQAWPQLTAWQRKQMRGRAPEIRTIAGRTRLLDKDASGTIRANTPVQGSAADGFKAALGRLLETRDLFPSAVPVLAVHDELVVECDAEDAEGVAAWVTVCLQEGMGRFLKRVPVRVEVMVAPDWAGTA